MEKEKRIEQGSSQVSAVIEPSSEEGPVSSIYAVPGNASYRLSMLTANLRGYKFACHIDSGVDELAISDTIVNFLNSKFIFLSILNQAQTFKTVYGRTVRSPIQVEIRSVLSMLAGNVAYEICICILFRTRTPRSEMVLPSQEKPS